MLHSRNELPEKKEEAKNKNPFYHGRVAKLNHHSLLYSNIVDDASRTTKTHKDSKWKTLRVPPTSLNNASSSTN